MELLKLHFEETDLECPACGYEDEAGEWSAEAEGRVIHYRHECPRCGAEQDRTLTVDETDSVRFSFGSET